MTAPQPQFSIKYPDGKPNDKKGSTRTASMHLFSMMVGPAVLSLPSAASWLGWVVSPILICVFYAICVLSSYMLVSVYEVNGVFHSRYHQAVRHILTPRHALVISIVQFVVLILVSISRVITAATALQNMAKLACGSGSDCFSSYAVFCAVFGVVEIFLSLVPSLDDAAWISTFGTACSMTYLTVTIVLSLTKAGNLGGTAFGRTSTSANKAFNMMSSLGNLMQSYNCAQMLMEIEDTMHQPGSAPAQMHKALYFAQTAAFFFYSMVMVSGYLAFGNDVQGMVLSSFDSPVWALAIANALLALNMMASFQVVAHGVFETIESHIKMVLLRRQLRKEGLDNDSGSQNLSNTAESLDPIAEAELSAINEEESLTLRPPRFADLKYSPKYQMYSMTMGFNKVCEAGVEKRLYNQLSMSRKRPPSSTQTPPCRSTEARGKPKTLQRQYTTNFEEYANSSAKFTRSTTMFRTNCGLANEEVPQNSEHFVLPIWIRFIPRTLFVFLVTAVGISLPNFKDFIGFFGCFQFLSAQRLLANIDVPKSISSEPSL
ncbi:hypothetical protein Ndes2437B_g06946 [Nannochloris sp. 'desiccata']